MTFLNDYLGTPPSDPRATAIEITPRAFYVAEHSTPAEHRFAFGYHIKIANRGAEPVQLIDRHWHIDQGNGCIHEVQGEGVIGEQPQILPGGFHQYQSGAIIETPAGRMWGDYGFVDKNGAAFRVKIPLFHLVAPSDYRPLH
ncbi:MAG: Co2+/Mg2+ efflux protein ApaG [Halothiobacillaceae bacterium]|jgi:ApaG protein|nr:Co2+/Mg2+ efflux protein ApaG [Halothiobacillaceae bacterium]OZA80151.1 MAG: Co2+/Mg2+ efflux protein ApaG [Halothiobacillus sp. 39-53-45]HQS03371.1 Co2+/Mg2+ efflux protein ApaG [Halothiobacillus sp.]